MHDRNQASVWLIDFAKTVVLPNNIKINHGSIWSVGNHEDGYLIGINNLIDIFEELQTSTVAASDVDSIHTSNIDTQVPRVDSTPTSNSDEQIPGVDSIPTSNSDKQVPGVDSVPTSNNDEQMNNNSEKMCNLSIES